MQKIKLFGGEIEVISADEVAKAFKVHPVTIRRYFRIGKMKGQKVGGRWYISKENFKDFVNGKTGGKI